MKFKRNLILAGVVLVEIVILLVMIFSNSYFIAQSSSVVVEKSLGKDEKDFGNALDFMVGFFSIKQIGIVSAEDESGMKVCCEKTIDGLWCQNAFEIRCDDDFRKNPSICSETSFCQSGCCFDPSQGTCAMGSTKEKCESKGGVFEESCEELTQYNKGCCHLGRNTDWVTSSRCRILSNIQGVEINFDESIDETQCKYYTDEEGACLFDDLFCERVTEEECDLKGGSWGSGKLCSSHYEEGLSICAPMDSVNCAEDKVKYPEIYWYDSCGNRENIYEGNSKTQKDRAWNEGFIKPKDESCGATASDGNAEDKNCGNCMYPSDSICKETSVGETSIDAGNFICADLNCEFEGETYENGESWCVYDGYTGESRDAVGASQFIRYCQEGEVITEKCGLGYRDELCAEFQYPSGRWQAQCRPNLWGLCLEANELISEKSTEEAKETCEMNSDCRWHELDVDDYFKFSACVPNYPQGKRVLSFEEELLEGDVAEETNICDLGSLTCKVMYKKNLEWDGLTPHAEEECVANCECTDAEFVKAANEFCVSLGDCGGYVNVDNSRGGWGVYTDDGFSVKGDNKIDLEEEYTLYPYGKENTRNEESEEPGNVPRYLPMEEGEGYFPGEDISFYNEVTESDFEREGFGEYIWERWAFGGQDDWSGWRTLTIYAGLLPLIADMLQYAFGFGSVREVEIKFKCMSWQPPVGGDSCELCNEGDVPCTEYKCRSLGTGCDLLEPEDPSIEVEDPPCANVYCQEGGVPVGREMVAVGSGFKKEAHNSGSREIGATVTLENGKPIVEGTDVNFTIETSDWAICKWVSDDIESGLFDEYGELPVEGSRFTKNHTFGITMPWIEDPSVSSDSYEIYLRCKEKCERVNEDSYKIEFKLDPTPDIKPPVILEPVTGSEVYVKYGETSKAFEITLDEAANCRYALSEGTEYGMMPLSFACNYAEKTCGTVVTDLLDDVSNVYVKCSDRLGNNNTEDFHYSFVKSLEELSVNIDSPTNNSVFKLPFDEEPLVLQASTSGGILGGEAECGYRIVGLGEDVFLETGATIHSQTFSSAWSPNEYKISVLCKDAAENQAQDEIFISVEKDETPPIVTRVFSSKFLTNEEAICYYNNSEISKCGFDIESSTAITSIYSLEHSINFEEGLNYYIKCEDPFENYNRDCVVTLRA